MKRVAILGSTGSIGKQTLQVIEQNTDKFIVSALVAYSNKDLLKTQQKQFNVDFVCLLNDKLAADDGIFYGNSYLEKAVETADVVVVATRGILALPAVLKALFLGKEVAIANKEILVSAGALIAEALKGSTAKLLPVDSEHSAIFQCLQGQSIPEKIILTCSGGAFWGKRKNELNKLSSKDALCHPKWRMGDKITIDSATLINKGFEVIEAHWLFGVDIDKIDVVIHPQSVVHSLVEFCDGSILAQLGVTDMRLPISYALNYPDRLTNTTNRLDLKSISDLQFLPVDNDVFEGIEICINSFKMHKLMPAVLVASDDIVVDYYLKDKIKFFDIYKILKSVCENYKNRINCIKFDVQSILALDKEVKDFTINLIEDKYVTVC